MVSFMFFKPWFVEGYDGYFQFQSFLLKLSTNSDLETLSTLPSVSQAHTIP